MILILFGNGGRLGNGDNPPASSQWMQRHFLGGSHQQ
jgi:hypothetical protein